MYLFQYRQFHNKSSTDIFGAYKTNFTIEHVNIFFYNVEPKAGSLVDFGIFSPEKPGKNMYLLIDRNAYPAISDTYDYFVFPYRN